MYIGGHPVLHIFDEGTRFSASRFLSSVSTEKIRQNIIERWENICAGLPNKLLTERGSAFGKKVKHLDKIADVEVSRIGVEEHLSFGIGEHDDDDVLS